ncbi:hypothetical protein [Rhodopseudomonas sp. BR0G17]|uniref:hypothetical protein n=1 Tax=Rhodopseudomonas sp. BR0G17 TaxID=2269368 RepID=UPI0013DF4C0F|nr:hypothetical protein [Rhodopseudomonas sp. BR0G17]
MLEITGDYVAELNDKDLRTLVGLLCEAELRRRRLPTSAVTWGGDHSAKDGGLDVYVALPAGTAIDGFVPRAITGFQIKKSDMPRSAIIHEMRPNDSIRRSIIRLAKEGGAYIIVSGAGSTSDSALQSRRAAMAEALHGLPELDRLALDFLDRGRLATWVRDHAGLVLWVREKIGKAIPGWQPFGNWSNAPKSTTQHYLHDSDMRIVTGRSDDGNGLSTIDGLNRIRELLHTPGKVVRLVGLSGVGKTRLLEALFDDSIGRNSLDPALAVYTDIADQPDPPPHRLALDLSANEMRAVLCIDNCSPSIHHSISKVVRGPRSSLSLISVEYDIRDDQPEGTDVFMLAPASIELIQTLVARRFSHLSQSSVRTVAAFSGGNARIAIALANTIVKDEAITGLRDEDLFRRLFQQRHEHNHSLLLIAQACSLVYSFDASENERTTEVPILGGMISKSPDEMHRGLAELRRRDLVQKRDVWCAVLPHAIANRLASIALQSIPFHTIKSALIKRDPSRLLVSFSRRLGLLYGSNEARDIATEWLSPGGLLFDIANLSKIEREIFVNIAALVPDKSISCIERMIASDNFTSVSHRVVSLIQLLACDHRLFDRSGELLATIVARHNERKTINDAARAFESFFDISLPSTRAPVEQRLSLLERVMRSDSPKMRNLGLSSFGAMIRVKVPNSSYTRDFKSAKLDGIAYSESESASIYWHKLALALFERLAISMDSISAALRRIVGAHLFDLLETKALHGTIERVVHSIASNGSSPEGWLAIKRMLTYRTNTLTRGSIDRLIYFEEQLRPKDLVSSVRAFILSNDGSGTEFDGIESFLDAHNAYSHGPAERVTNAIAELARRVASERRAFDALLPELITGGRRVWQFGYVMAQSCRTPHEYWDAMALQFRKSPEKYPEIMAAFLAGWQIVAPRHVDAALDAALEDSVLGSWFPYFQANVTINEAALVRLHKALELELAPVHRYSHLASATVWRSMSSVAFSDLVLTIARKLGGDRSALHILATRIRHDANHKQAASSDIINAGQEVLRNYELDPSRQYVSGREEMELSLVSSNCLLGDPGESVTRLIVGRIRRITAYLETNSYAYLLSKLVELQTHAVLDELFNSNQSQIVAIVRWAERFPPNPLTSISIKSSLLYCNEDPARRYPIAAQLLPLFEKRDQAGRMTWNSLASLLIGNAPEPHLVLASIVERLSVSDESVNLLMELDVDGDAGLVELRREAVQRLREHIERARADELSQNRHRAAFE